MAKVREYAAEHHGCETVVISAQIESELIDCPKRRRRISIRDGCEGKWCRAVQKSHSLLGLQTYFTTGEDARVDNPQGDTAPKAAGVIHGDFERGFIKAETVAYTDLIECGSIAAARDRGLYRMEGKEYVVQEGDVMLFKFNVTGQALAKR